MYVLFLVNDFKYQNITPTEKLSTFRRRFTEMSCVS